MNTLVDFLPVAAVGMIYILRIKELWAKRSTIPGKVYERWTLRLFLLTGHMMFFGSFFEFFYYGRVWRTWMFVLGCVCAGASFAIRRKAIAALGQFWSLHPEIREEHHIVQRGIFRWVRHPTYLSMILELLSIGLILHAPRTGLITALLFLPVLWLRLRVEERSLVSKFGADYEMYRRRTPMLIPYKWSAKPDTSVVTRAEK